MSAAAAQAEKTPSVALTLMPIMGVVFVGFLVIGLALPVLPLYVHDELGLGPFVVGLVTGSQFAASLLARVWSGRTSDIHGPKRAIVIGLAAAIAADVLSAQIELKA